MTPYTVSFDSVDFGSSNSDFACRLLKSSRSETDSSGCDCEGVGRVKGTSCIIKDTRRPKPRSAVKTCHTTASDRPNASRTCCCSGSGIVGMRGMRTEDSATLEEDGSLPWKICCRTSLGRCFVNWPWRIGEPIETPQTYNEFSLDIEVNGGTNVPPRNHERKNRKPKRVRSRKPARVS